MQMTKLLLVLSLSLLSLNGHARSSNYDGSYTISYSDILCGNLGYAFKQLHQKDGYSSVGKMHKSNCKKSPNGMLEGYIYPKTHPHLRIFWVQTVNGVYYKD